MLKNLGAVLGLLQQDADAFMQGKGVGDDLDIQALIKARIEAKSAKNFAEADRIRAELTDVGILLEDTPQGTIWRKA